MAKNSQRAMRKPKTDKMKEENSVEELTFAYAFDCLNEATFGNQFLGFTLSLEYVPVHKSRSEELSKLRYYFAMKVLQDVIVWSVKEQREPVIKWTDREAMDTYLKLNGAK